MNKLLTSVLVGLVSASTLIKADPTRPRLVVGIVVDQLRTDYIEYLQSLFGEHGFRKLMANGAYIRDVDFGVQDIDRVSATAMIYTGAYPSQSGITGGEVYSSADKKMVPILTDPSKIGNFTNESYSPASLLLSTISDELAIDGDGLGAIYSISTSPQQAVIMAGHAGNAAVWLNDNTGKWASSDYYHDMPKTVSDRNYHQPLLSRLDTMQWKPLLKINRYPGIPPKKRQYPFGYTFSRSDRDVYRKFASSALSNREVTDIAIDCLRSLKLGNRGEAIDMLNIGYTAAPFKYAKDGDYRLELQDTYIRLDGQITRLFEAIDNYVGLDNALICLTSTGYYDDATPDDSKYRIPGGDLSLKRATSLLNAYLSAKYGNADYVESFISTALRLDHKQIEKKNLSVSEVAAESRDFLRRMSGVSDARTSAEILSSTSTFDSWRLALDPKNVADVYIVPMAGWNLLDDTSYPTRTTTYRSSMVSTPAFIMGAQVPVTIINTPVQATTLAPTVSGILRIRSPNGSVSRPLPL
jgi:hypothetical protein